MAFAGTVEAVDLPFQEAIDYFAQKANVTTTRWTDVWETAHTRAFMVAGAASEALVKDLRGAIQKAIETGTTLEEFRKDFGKIVDKHGWHGWTGEGNAAGRAWRTRTIYETNLNMAYAAGRYAQMSDPDVLRIYPFWVYRHSGNPHPRLQHKAWDGLTLAATDTWWSTNYPPNGFGCGCTVEPVSARGLVRQGKTGPDEAPPMQMTEKLVGRSSTRTQLTPAGVDPGFAYNPGLTWKGEVKPPSDTRMQASPGFRPAPPAPPAPKLSEPGPSKLQKAADRIPTKPQVAPETDAELDAWFKEAMPPPAPSNPIPKPPATEPPRKGLPIPKSPEDLRLADRRLREHYDGWAKALSGAESSTLAAYKGAGYSGMNKHLAGLGARPALTPVIKTLDQALAAAPPTPMSMTVFRGVDPSDPFAKARVGKVFQPGTFLSTSIREATADNFSAGVLIEIRVPEAYHGVAWVHPYPDVQHVEWEMLFRPGSRFRVISRDGNRMIVEAVDEPNRRPRLTPRRTRPSP